MRVIGGTNRGRILRAPKESVRPTSDRVREAMFDVLGSLTEIDGTSVADLFAGSGALGIEAISRGASRAVFVDQDPQALHFVRSNLVSSGLLDRTVVQARWGDAQGRRLPKTVRPPASERLVLVEGQTVELVRADVTRWLTASTFGVFDLAFVDPPYSFDGWAALLDALEARVAILESDRAIEVPERFDVARTKRYGGTLVTVVRSAETSVS